jgi:predicted phosphoribosyltransferase
VFVDRKNAGEKLAKALQRFKGKDVVVLAIPRGGVVVGYEVACWLDSEFSVLISQELPFPHNSRSGFGAVAEDGSVFIFKGATRWLGKELMDSTIEDQKREVKRRIEVLRKGDPLLDIDGKTVILIDDGIAMGAKMAAAVMLCKNRGAGKIIVAAPVAARAGAEELGKLVDEMVILEKPEQFMAVAQVYANWYDVPDGDVIDILYTWKRGRP